MAKKPEAETSNNESSSTSQPPSSTSHPPAPPPPLFLSEREGLRSAIKSQSPLPPPPPPKKNPMLPPKKAPAPPPKLPPKVAITEAKEVPKSQNYPEIIVGSSNVDVKRSVTKLGAPSKHSAISVTELPMTTSNSSINDKNLTVGDSKKKNKSTSDILGGKLSRLSIRSFGWSKSRDIVAKEEEEEEKEEEEEEEEDLPRPPSSLLGDTLSAYHDLGPMPSPPPYENSGDVITCN